MSNSTRPLYDWCGKRCNGFIYHESAIGFFFGKEFCSKRCLSYYQNQKKRDDKEKIAVKTSRKKQVENPIRDARVIKTKEEIDLDFYEREKEFEFEKQQELFEIEKDEKIKTQRELNYKAAKSYLESGGNKYLYYFKILWAFLDKPWKKLVVIFLLWWLISSIYKSI